MFTKTDTVNTRMAVIEEKFNLYEKMMNKVESAIQTISEINQNISRMLSVHQEKIDSNMKTDEIIFEKFRRMEEKNDDDHKKVIEKIENMEKTFKDAIKEESKERGDVVKDLNQKLSSLMRFRWFIAGGLLVLGFIISKPNIVVDILTPDSIPAKIESVN